MCLYTFYNIFNKVNFSKMGNLEEAIVITNKIGENIISDEIKSQTTIKEVDL